MSHARPTSLALMAAALAAACGSDSEPAPPKSGGALDVEKYLSAPKSCAYLCPIVDCPEVDEGYVCPALEPWASIPHLDECPAWDGTYPSPVEGECSASAPSNDALKRPGPDPDDPATLVLPDGRRMRAAGAEQPLDQDDMLGGMTVTAIAATGTPWVIAVDVGNEDHAVRAIDPAAIGAGNPVTGFVKFQDPELLGGGAAFVAPDRVYVATHFGVVQALALDPMTGALSRDDAASLAMPEPTVDSVAWLTTGLAASPDGKLLVATGIRETRALVFDVDPTSPTYQTLVGEVDLGSDQTFGVAFDPFDPAGRLAYVSMWDSRSVVELDLTAPERPVVTRSFDTDDDPQGVAFLDARWMAIANDLGETISLADRTDGSVVTVPVDFEPDLRGLDVSSLAWDATSQRLYATLAGINAIGAWDVDLSGVRPSLLPVGKLPAAWWPSAIVVRPDGSLVVANLRGHGMGAYDEELPIGEGDGDDQMHGSVQRISAPSAADLQTGELDVRAAVAVGERDGYPQVECPAGVMDFPVPATNDQGPSPVIDRIVFIVRENKTFDALLGDMPGVEGEPAYAMKDTPEEMEQVWPNFRELARTFALSDNFYNLAVQSTQGHTWTTYGRANDFGERTWSDEVRPVPLSGVGDVGRPIEGSLFDWLQNNAVRYDILGEIVGNPEELPIDYNPIDVLYPGGPVQNISYNDDEKACHTAGRARVACDLGTFVYMTLPNDHTVGASPENPTAEAMCATNDEATGMVVDALSHSPFWKGTLVVITEDDPQQGGDHVDYHRTPLVFVSPWVKRGWVSQVHIDVASLHKLFAHLLGLPYPNLVVKNAALPLDAFTSTPDYTPYTYIPRRWPVECGVQTTSAEKELTDSWDFDEVDEQPGLGAQVMRWMRRQQLEELTPELRREVDARNARARRRASAGQ